MNYTSENIQSLVKDKNRLIQEENSDLKRKIRVLENRLRLKESLLSSSLNSTLITDSDGLITWVNKAFEELTGYTAEEVINKNPRFLKSGLHDDKFYKNLWDTISSGNVWKGEITNKKKDGTLYFEKIEISPVRNNLGEIIHYVAIKQDITGQKKTDKALNDSYIKYEELAYIFNQSPAVGFSWSEDDTHFVEFVTENIKQWEYTPEDFYSQKFTFEDIIYEEDKEKILTDLRLKIDSGAEKVKQQYRIVTKSGEIRWVDSHFHVRLAENNLVTHLQGVVLDVTERKKAEEEAKYQFEQLMQADKMIALGTLVSGVAHEINNPNNFVMLNIPLIEKVWFKILPILENHMKENGDFYVGERIKFSKIKESMPMLLGGIYDGSQRIKNIVKDLKSFARKDNSGYDQEVDLNKVLQTSVNLTANLISKATDNFYVKYSNTAIFVKGNKQKLEQVLINLIENSCQSLEDRTKKIVIEVTHSNNCGLITVADEGKGMENTLLRKIKDPFFTTKRNKGGTGLGLSIASTIIMEHDGKLEFESQPGEGTKSTVRLPLFVKDVKI